PSVLILIRAEGSNAHPARRPDVDIRIAGCVAHEPQLADGAEPGRGGEPSGRRVRSVRPDPYGRSVGSGQHLLDESATETSSARVGMDDDVGGRVGWTGAVVGWVDTGVARQVCTCLRREVVSQEMCGRALGAEAQGGRFV